MSIQENREKNYFRVELILIDTIAMYEMTRMNLFNFIRYFKSKNVQYRYLESIVFFSYLSAEM